jgi:predicted choloylglycine hydrolase
MCTIAAIKDSGRYLLASNSDNPWDTRTRVRVCQGKNWRFIGTELICPDDSLPWSNMITRGINEKGIAFTFSYVHCSPDLYQGGIGFKDFGHHILGSFGSLTEIERYLRDEPLQIHGNFLFVDDLGNVLVGEIHPAKRHLEWNPGTTVFRTNHYLHLPIASREEIANTSSDLRFESGMYALTKEKESKNGSEFMQALLGNHHLKDLGSEWGASTCNHGQTAGTISSEIFDPADKIISYCYGSPCGDTDQMKSWGEYVSFPLRDYSEGEVTNLEGEIINRR